ncbi:TBC1 domain family member 5 homolog A-like [Macrobrachium nipponense]|uniref:TBC1 domain family member 5 homolog A-like n=1 Tax=Macrobrachium nipponense TaxID=159736 RepID=UPI0030C7CDD7
MALCAQSTTRSLQVTGFQAKVPTKERADGVSSSPSPHTANRISIPSTKGSSTTRINNPTGTQNQESRSLNQRKRQNDYQNQFQTRNTDMKMVNVSRNQQSKQEITSRTNSLIGTTSRTNSTTDKIPRIKTGMIPSSGTKMGITIPVNVMDPTGITSTMISTIPRERNNNYNQNNRDSSQYNTDRYGNNYYNSQEQNSRYNLNNQNRNNQYKRNQDENQYYRIQQRNNQRQQYNDNFNNITGTEIQTTITTLTTTRGHSTNKEISSRGHSTTEKVSTRVPGSHRTSREA